MAQQKNTLNIFVLSMCRSKISEVILEEIEFCKKHSDIYKYLLENYGKEQKSEAPENMNKHLLEIALNFNEKYLYFV
jgi:altronate dehydratase